MKCLNCYEEIAERRSDAKYCNRSCESRYWSNNNIDKVRKSSKNWRERNPELSYKRIKHWQQNKGKDKVRRYTHNRRVKKYNNGGSHTLKQFKTLVEALNNVCPCCYEKKKLTIDHIVPLSQGGSDYISNIQPLCISCNSRKGTKSTIYFRIRGD